MPIKQLQGLKRSGFHFVCTVAGLRIGGVRVAFSDRLRCNGHGGGSLGAQMNLFDRFARVIKVYN